MYVINGLTNFDLLQICDPILLKGSWSKYDKFLISQSKVYDFFIRNINLIKSHLNSDKTLNETRNNFLTINNYYQISLSKAGLLPMLKK